MPNIVLESAVEAKVQRGGEIGCFAVPFRPSCNNDASAALLSVPGKVKERGVCKELTNWRDSRIQVFREPVDDGVERSQGTPERLWQKRRQMPPELRGRHAFWNDSERQGTK